MSTRKNQKMIYVSDDNLDFYENMKDKSEWINKKLKELRLAGDVEDKSTEFDAKIAKLRQLDIVEELDGHRG